MVVKLHVQVNAIIINTTGRNYTVSQVNALIVVRKAAGDDLRKTLNRCTTNCQKKTTNTQHIQRVTI